MYDFDPEEVDELGWEEFVTRQWESVFAGYRSWVGMRSMGRRWSDLLEAGLRCSPQLADRLVSTEVVHGRERDLAGADPDAVLSGMLTVLTDVGDDLAKLDAGRPGAAGLLANHVRLVSFVRELVGDDDGPAATPLVDPAFPELVEAAMARAYAAGFGLSCEPEVGRLLAVLAAHLSAGARVLELGTGTGVGTAWLVSGLLPRTDVTVVTVEIDPGRAAVAAHGDWPPFVDLRTADALDVLGTEGTFDLIFADAQGGKSIGLDRTITAIRPGGMLVVDDMTPQPDWSKEQRTGQATVRETLLTDPVLTSVALDHGSGVILATRKR